MNRKIVMLLVYCALIILVLLAYFFVKSKSANTEIVLKTNAGVSYKWRCNAEDENIVKIGSSYTVNKAKREVTGGPLEVHYELKGLKKGSTKITCEYYNFVNNEVENKEVYNIKVDKLLKVKIK